jgi:hypothetical protein
VLPAFIISNLRRYLDNIKKGFKEKGFEGVGWINLSQVTDLWRDFVNTAMNFYFHKNWRILLLHAVSQPVKRGGSE